MDIFKGCFKVILQELMDMVYQDSINGLSKLDIPNLTSIKEIDEEQSPVTDRDLQQTNTKKSLDIFNTSYDQKDLKISLGILNDTDQKIFQDIP